ncbi:MAG: GNAT family N-acetyltransferase [Pseudomonadota bacterium]
MTIETPIIETPRLRLRPLELGDAEAIQTVFPKWEIVEFLSNNVPWPYPSDGALTFIRDIALPAVERGVEWHWSIRPRKMPEKLIGVISLMKKPNDNRGFWLDPSWQAQGLMSEASAAVTDFWFEVLEQPVLRVPKAVANERSRRISERSGMRVVETMNREYVSGCLPSEIWEITRKEWEEHTRPL